MTRPIFDVAGLEFEEEVFQAGAGGEGIGAATAFNDGGHFSPGVFEVIMACLFDRLIGAVFLDAVLQMLGDAVA